MVLSICAILDAALQRHEGKVASAARDLGVHRNQLRRWLAARLDRAAAPDPEGD